MIFVFLLLGVVLIVAAVRNSQGALFSALGEDVPGYFVWAAALLALGAIGWVPGLKPVSRGLLALVIVVLVLHNYQNIIKGFQNAGKFQASGNAGATAPSGIGSPAATGAASSWMPSWLQKLIQPNIGSVAQ